MTVLARAARSQQRGDVRAGRGAADARGCPVIPVLRFLVALPLYAMVDVFDLLGDACERLAEEVSWP